MNKKLIWKSEIDDSHLEFLREEYPDLSESELYELAQENNANYLDDERTNLDIQLSRPIIVIADLGLWSGRKSGYKVIESGNIKDCLYDNSDDVEWYVTARNEFCAQAIHHDGVNHYRYRVFKDECTERQIERFKEKIYCGTVTSKDITRYTRRLGDYIGNVYGW